MVSVTKGTQPCTRTRETPFCTTVPTFPAINGLQNKSPQTTYSPPFHLIVVESQDHLYDATERERAEVLRVSRDSRLWSSDVRKQSRNRLIVLGSLPPVPCRKLFFYGREDQVGRASSSGEPALARSRRGVQQPQGSTRPGAQGVFLCVSLRDGSNLHPQSHNARRTTPEASGEDSLLPRCPTFSASEFRLGIVLEIIPPTTPSESCPRAKTCGGPVFALF